MRAAWRGGGLPPSRAQEWVQSAGAEGPARRRAPKVGPRHPAGSLRRHGWARALRLGAASLIACLGVGCAGVVEQVRVRNEVVRHERHQVRDSTAPIVELTSARVVGTSLQLSLKQHYECRNVTTPIVQQTRYVVRRARPVGGAHPLLWEFGGATLLLGSGVSSYASADKLAAQETDPNTGQSGGGDPRTYRTIGLALAGVAAIPLVLGIVDAVRLRDTKEVALVRGRPEEVKVVCEAGPAAATPVTLRFNEGTRMRARTDAQGTVTFSMLRVPAAALLDGAALGVLQDGNGLFSIPVVVSPEQHQGLVARLRHTPTSRFATELEAEERRRCRAALDATVVAQKEGEEGARLLELLEAAKSRCGEHWSARDAERLAVVRAQLAKQRCDATVAAAVLLSARSSSVPDATAAVGALEQAKAECQRCWGAKQEVALKEAQAHRKSLADAEAQRQCRDAVAAVRRAADGGDEGLEAVAEQARAAQAGVCRDQASEKARLAAAVAALRQRQQLRREAERLRGSMADFVVAVRRGAYRAARDAVVQDAALQRHLAAAPDTRSALAHAIDEAVSAVLASGAKGAVGTNMCEARRLFIAVLGHEAWRLLKKRIAQKYSTSAPLEASKLIRALDAGRCK